MLARLSFSLRIALRYLWSRRAEAFISIITVTSILGVAIGVMVLTIVMAVMTGFEEELREKIVGTNSHVVVRRLGGLIHHWKEADETIAKLPEVASVSPFTYHQVLLRYEARATGILIRGVEEGTAAAAQLGSYLENNQALEQLFRPPAFNEELAKGSAPPSADLGDHEGEGVHLPGIIVGKQLATTLGLYVGMPISLLSPSVSSTPFGLMPRYRRFLVVGIYNSGLVEYESNLAYISLPEAQQFFRLGDGITGFEVRVKNFDRAPTVAREITDALPGFIATDWTETNKPLWDAIKLEKQVYFIVLLLIIVMASFSIISTLVMIVLEKRKDIAVMKTMGATSGRIAAIFVYQGSIIGGVGTGLGLLLGLGGCWALRKYGFPIDEKIFQMSTLPIRIEWVNFALVGGAAFIICTLATIYPAWRASTLEPSDVLRYE